MNYALPVSHSRRLVKRSCCLRHVLRLTCWLLLGALGSQSALANASSAGIEFEANGVLHQLPAASSEYVVEIHGNVANVRLRQTFVNTHSEPVHTRYLFPLNKAAAVHRMRMRVGNEEIEARIATIEKAQQTYKRAKAQGKAAALLRQHRPNMFTQRIANLMPGAPVEIELEYVQRLPKLDGEYELVIPTVVGPRYQPKKSVAQTFAPAPAYPPVPSLQNPQWIPAKQVQIEVQIQAGQRISGVASSSHTISISETSDTARKVQLDPGSAVANRDFVLRYALADAELSAGLMSHWGDAEPGYFNLLIEPPAAAELAPSVPREMVFLLDCSGSMSGLPMQASKAFMRRALNGLQPQDSFRIVRFSDVATEFSSTPLAATPGNVRKGLAYTETLQGSGGTIMSSGVYQALAASEQPGRVRQVVFLTDGYIGNEFEILRLVSKHLGDARLYSFGVGTAVNRFLLDELARVGRGFARYMDPTADVEETAARLVGHLQHPVLTRLWIDWQELPVAQMLPQQLPDLFAGESVQVQGRFLSPAAGNILIRGLSATGAEVQIERWIELTSASDKPALAQTWARAQIKSAMHQFTAPRDLRPRAESGETLTDADLQEQITELGLKHRLVTQWTAFVAVSKRLVNPEPQQTPDVAVPLEKVAGVSSNAYPTSAFTGFGTPEPSDLSGMLLLLVLVGAYLLVCRRSGLVRRGFRLS